MWCLLASVKILILVFMIISPVLKEAQCGGKALEKKSDGLFNVNSCTINNSNKP